MGRFPDGLASLHELMAAHVAAGQMPGGWPLRMAVPAADAPSQRQLTSPEPPPVFRDFWTGRVAAACQRGALAGHSGGVRGRQQPDDRTRVERFERVFAEHSRQVFAYAARRAPERADDVVAETFAIAWRRLDDLPRDAEPWLYGVARRVLAGQWRSQARQSALVSRLVEVGPDVAEDDDELDHSLLREALGRLAERDREALLLIYWEGLEPERAAAVLEISRDALNQRVHRARERLRARCKEAKAAP